MTIEQGLALAGAVVAVTTFLVTGGDWLIRKWLQKHRDELINTLTAKANDLHDDLKSVTGERNAARAELTITAAALENASVDLAAERTEHLALKTTASQLANDLATANNEIEDTTQSHRAHTARIKSALKLKGALWTQPTMAGTPKFVPLAERRTPIVSVLNLKGGVGKTTLTAYLARALAARGYRILLIDLDLQGSLSSLFIPTLELSRLAKSGGKFLHDLLSPDPGTHPGKLTDYTQPVPLLGPHSRILPTTDRLAYAELSQTVQWLLRVGGKSHTWNGRRDGRMILRKSLHRPTQYRKFDIVLMDCPPIINLCCANALAASDYVLTPVTPSLKSIERVPPLLKRILEVQGAVNESLRMMGIVVNNTRQMELTPQESDLFLTLPEQCLTVFGGDVYRFDTSIPSRVAIRDREQEFGGPETDPDLRKTFDTLAEEFLKKLPGFCRHPNERKKQPKTMGGM